MGYLYTRALAGAEAPPTPAKKKRTVAAPKKPKTSKPKPTPTPPAAARSTTLVNGSSMIPPSSPLPNSAKIPVRTNNIVSPSPPPSTQMRSQVPTMPVRNLPNPIKKPGESSVPVAKHTPKVDPPVIDSPSKAKRPKLSTSDDEEGSESEKTNTKKDNNTTPTHTLRNRSKPAATPEVAATATPTKPVTPTPNTRTSVAAAKPTKHVTPTSNTRTSSAAAKGKTKATTTTTTTESSRPSRSVTASRGKKRTIDIDEEEEEEEGEGETQPQKRGPKSRRQYKPLPIISGTYKLSLVFKGHTDINIPAKDANDNDLEDAKDIWCCEFEPHRTTGQTSNNIVAICGSYSVLFLDTQQGRYTKKFTHAEIQEIFYCMAWTTLNGQEVNNDLDDEEDPSCNILAIAGRLGSIKLLNPLQNECYRYLFGHDKAVLKLAFAKTEPRWLFSASADKTVRLWDIGSPTSKDDDSVCLAKFNLSAKSGVPSALSISHDLSTLMVGFEDGDMISFKLTSLLEKFRSKSAAYRLKESRTGNKWHDFGPIATVEPKTVYPKGGEWHEGYIDDIYIFGQDGDTSSKLYNKIISRGAEDMEFIIWDPIKSTKTDANIQLSLEWPDSAGCTGLRYKVIEAEGQKVLIAGEYDGQIYIYNVGDMKNSKTLEDNSMEQFKPNRMLSHKMSSELIRDVCCSNDTRTIVAVDNNNTAFIWNCIE